MPPVASASTQDHDDLSEIDELDLASDEYEQADEPDKRGKRGKRRERHRKAQPRPPLLADYLTRPELAEQLDVCERTVQRLESMREGPPMTKIAGKRYYRREAVLQWLQDRETKPMRQAKRGRV